MEIFPKDILIHIINIVVLFVLLRVLLYKPVRKFMDARAARIQKEMEDAEEAKKQAQALQEEIAAQRSAAEKQAADIVAEGERQAAEQAGKLLADARGEAAKIIDFAHKKADFERNKAIGEAQKDIADAAVDMAGKIIGREISAKDNEKLIEEFFDQVK